MRGVSEGATTTLVAAQWLGSRLPYFKIVFTSKDGLTTYDFSTDSATYGDRLLGIDHREEISEEGGTAKIYLENHDELVPDLRGYWTEIGYGLNTGTVVSPTYEYAKTARLWVKYQSKVYFRGMYYVILELEDFVSRMQETIVHRIGYWSKPFFYQYYEGFTVYEWLYLLIAGETRDDSTSDVIYTDITVEDSDGIIDIVKPKFEINRTTGEYETLFQVVMRLLNITKCFMRFRPSLVVTFVYPGGDTTPDITYYRDTEPQWTSFNERTGLVRPNKCYVFGGADVTFWEDVYGVQHAEWDWASAVENMTIIEGSYENTTETDRYEECERFELVEGIRTKAEADQRAEVSVLHRQPSDTVGRVLVRHDCRVELYDRVAVITNA